MGAYAVNSLEASRLKQYLKDLAEQETADHDDLFGESPDDAYNKGESDGYVLLARELLTKFFPEE